MGNRNVHNCRTQLDQPLSPTMGIGVLDAAKNNITILFKGAMNIHMVATGTLMNGDHGKDTLSWSVGNRF